MTQLRIRREVAVEKTPRVAQVMGMFDVPERTHSVSTWDFAVDLPSDWVVGLIVGPSGAGKSTVARELFGDAVAGTWWWPASRSVLDGFPAAMGIKEVTGLLSSVGFGSPPSWLRPYHALSNGERFRVDLARTLAEMPGLAVVDEFTSVVDRQVARIGSHAAAKAARARGQRFVGVSCHYDILEWLDPDWVLEPHLGTLTRRSLRGRPLVDLEVFRASVRDWAPFEPHHYMNAKIHPSASCWVATLGGVPCAFASWMHFPHPLAKDLKMAHRFVVLPDYQGLGIGGALADWAGARLAGEGFRLHFVTAHPGLVRRFNRSPRWRLCRRGDGVDRIGPQSLKAMAKHLGMVRRFATFSFEYVPGARETTPARALAATG